jgi:predicted ATPase
VQTLSGERGQYRLEKAPTELQISPTVQGVLAARIDRLAAEEKDLLHQLAIIGRQFPLSLVRQVVTQSEEALYHLLASLQRKEFLYEQPAFPEVEYTFKHALTQEVAYGAMLQERRKALHERTAQAIETLYRATLDEHYSELAHHYSHSGNTQKAVEYLHLAGQQAVQQSADAEAISHLTIALELIKSLPDTPKRSRQELRLLLTLGPVLMSIRGFAAPEVEALYTRARELCLQVGETAQLFPVLYGLWRLSLLRAELQLARELGEQLLPLAQQSHDSALLLGVHRALGTTMLWQGEIALAREQLSRCSLYDPQQHHPLAFFYGINLGVTCQILTAIALWLLGYPDQALQRGQEGITLAHEASHPFSLGFALGFIARLHQYRREWRLAQEQSKAAIALSAAQGFPYMLAQGTVVWGATLAAQGHEEEGITQIRQVMATLEAVGGGIERPYFLALLAEAHAGAGQAEKGLAALAEALTVADKTGERWYEAELYRLKGELTLQQLSVVSNGDHHKPGLGSQRKLSWVGGIFYHRSKVERNFVQDFVRTCKRRCAPFCPTHLLPFDKPLLIT